MFVWNVSWTSVLMLGVAKWRQNRSWIAGSYILRAMHVAITVMWDDKWSTIGRRLPTVRSFCLFVPDCTPSCDRRHQFYSRNWMTLCLFSLLPLMTRQWCIIWLSFTRTFSVSWTVTQPFSILCWNDFWCMFHNV